MVEGKKHSNSPASGGLIEKSRLQSMFNVIAAIFKSPRFEEGYEKVKKLLEKSETHAQSELRKDLSQCCLGIMLKKAEHRGLSGVISEEYLKKLEPAIWKKNPKKKALI